MKGLTKVGKVGFVAGALAWALGFVVFILIPMPGVDPRARAKYWIDYMLVVGPAGGIAGGIGGLAGQSLGLKGGLAPTLLLLVLPSVVNGVFWGALAQGIAWARVRARVVFWVLVLGVGLYWSWLLAMMLLVRG